MIGLLGALSAACAMAHYKWFLTWSRMDYRTVLAVQFPLLFAGTALLLPWFARFEPGFFEPGYLLLYALLIAIALIYNILHTRGIQGESLSEFELVDLLRPLFAILLAALFFADERDPIHLALAGGAFFVFLLTHLRHFHPRVKRADRFQLLAVFLMALELQFAKPLLVLASPVSLYAIRTGILATIFFVIFRPSLANISGRAWGHLVLNSVLGMTGILLQLTAIAGLGIVTTELIFLSIPLFLAIISVAIFHERWSLAQTVAFGLIFAAIAALQVL